MKTAVVVPWWNPEQRDSFLAAWMINPVPDWLFMEQDTDGSGCAKTKNRGILRALEADPEIVCVLDDDCYPEMYGLHLIEWASLHAEQYRPQKVNLFETVTDPPSRGTPYLPDNLSVELPVAAVMGFWLHNGDYCAPAQLVRGAETPMKFRHEAFFYRWFPMSGMNVSFRAEFWPFFKFDEEAGRHDDLFMGHRLMAEAYRRGYCVTTKGPTVSHARQSDPFKNLKVEAEFAERNEKEWTRYIPAPIKP